MDFRSRQKALATKADLQTDTKHRFRKRGFSILLQQRDI
jgi:hypothetical protein